MTRAGQFLVFLNLFASVALATWAVSLSANRLDWVDRQDGDKKVEGDITRLKKEIDAAVKGIAEVSAVYGRVEQGLAAAESGTEAGREGRDARRAVYLARLKDAQDGKFFELAKIPNRVLLDVSRPGTPVRLPNGQDLAGVEVYQKRLDDALRDSQAAQTAIVGLRERFRDLSEGEGGIRATEKRIADQREIAASLTNEARFLAAVQVNWDEELRTLRTRQRQLERRIGQVTGDKIPTGDGAQ